jgi:hypothetical protein
VTGSLGTRNFKLPGTVLSDLILSYSYLSDILHQISFSVSFHLKAFAMIQNDVLHSEKDDIILYTSSGDLGSRGVDEPQCAQLNARHDIYSLSPVCTCVCSRIGTLKQDA